MHRPDRALSGGPHQRPKTVAWELLYDAALTAAAFTTNRDNVCDDRQLYHNG